MADMIGILMANYKAVGLQTPSRSKYVNVDPAAYKGTWSAKYANGKSLTIGISEVSGYKAKVRFQVQGSSPLYQQVLIQDGSFRIGDNKFFLQKNGSAMIRSVVTNTATGGQSLETTYAKR
jgi:hypothetical protein